MNIETKLLADSVNPMGVRLTSMLFTYPRIVHAELMTHRVLSRNASSSRAIPVSKMIERVSNDPALPEYWGANRPGMQAAEELPTEVQDTARWLWIKASEDAVLHAEKFARLGVHKQLANRFLEPFSRI